MALIKFTDILIWAGLAVAASATMAGARPLSPAAPPPPDDRAIFNRNNTGGDVNVVVPRGATGAETYTSDSAAGGNVARPELAVPNGSGGGGSSGGSR